jgi:uncharacterized membrane protein YedE/YeeE
MAEMETTFTPLASLGGGLLIGAAAVLLMAVLGRIMGATGVLGGLLVPGSGSEFAWRAALVAGMVTAPVPATSPPGRAPSPSRGRPTSMSAAARRKPPT